MVKTTSAPPKMWANCLLVLSMRKGMTPMKHSFCCFIRGPPDSCHFSFLPKLGVIILAVRGDQSQKLVDGFPLSHHLWGDFDTLILVKWGQREQNGKSAKSNHRAVAKFHADMSYLRAGAPNLPGAQHGFQVSSQLSKADLLTFWFSNFGPFLEVPKADHLLVLGPLNN